MNRQYFIIAFLSLLALACQRELHFEDKPPPPAPPPVLGPEIFRGWTTTYYYKRGDSTKINRSVRIDSATKQIFLHDSLLNKPGAIINFDNNWKLNAIHYYNGGNLSQIDSFHRAPSGEIIYYLVLSPAGQVRFAYQLLQEDLGDSIKMRIRKIAPVDPTRIEGDDHYIINKATSLVSYIHHYSKHNNANTIDSNVITFRFEYGTADRALTKRIDVLDQKITGALNETRHTDIISDHSNHADRGSFEKMKQLDQMIFKPEIAWYRHGSELLTPFFTESSWKNISMLPSTEISQSKYLVNGSLSQQATQQYSTSFLKNAAGELTEIKKVRITPTIDPDQVIEMRTKFNYTR